MAHSYVRHIYTVTSFPRCLIPHIYEHVTYCRHAFDVTHSQPYPHICTREMTDSQLRHGSFLRATHMYVSCHVHMYESRQLILLTCEYVTKSPPYVRLEPFTGITHSHLNARVNKYTTATWLNLMCTHSCHHATTWRATPCVVSHICMRLHHVFKPHVSIHSFICAKWPIHARAFTQFTRAKWPIHARSHSLQRAQPPLVRRPVSCHTLWFPSTNELH